MRQIAADESRQPSSTENPPVSQQRYSPISDDEDQFEDLLQAAVNDSGIQSGVTISGEFVPCLLSDQEFREFLADAVSWRVLASSNARSVSCVQRGRFLAILAKLLFAKAPVTNEDWIAVEQELGRKLRRARRREGDE